MTLQLFYHPLASYCWKVLVGLYESGIEFERHLVDLGNREQRAELEALWPFVKFPLLRDTTTGEVTPESTILLEWLALRHPSARWLLAADAARALRTRALDRFFDTYVHEPMQKIVGDKLRAAGQHDPTGVEAARATLTTAYATLERRLDGEWADGEAFSLADCAAYPALYYANRVQSISDAHVKTQAYLARLRARPSVQRVMKEAEPYLHLFPG
ncbi:MAG TPA: glutathione S-transferase family protein [Polyangia bacterium]|nr:glutathione S-transferase family protein [Polyangia bacterium]